MVRAKFRCTSITEYEGADKVKEYAFSASSTGEENKCWSQWVPSGQLNLIITVPAAQVFEVGKEYHLDFSSVTP